MAIDLVGTRFVLVRHGETDATTQRLLCGRGDVPLNETGRRQAELIANRVAGDVVFSSPLRRARDTAALIAPPELADDLVEVDFGAWEGRSPRDLAPREFEAWLGGAAPPGGESHAAVARRVRRWARRASAEQHGRTVVVVAHGAPLREIVRLALGAGPAAFHRLRIDVASVSIVEFYAAGQASVVLLNDTSHLC